MVTYQSKSLEGGVRNSDIEAMLKCSNLLKNWTFTKQQQRCFLQE